MQIGIPVEMVTRRLCEDGEVGGALLKGRAPFYPLPASPKI
jgi:hypothetical protein